MKKTIVLDRETIKEYFLMAFAIVFVVLLIIILIYLFGEFKKDNQIKIESKFEVYGTVQSIREVYSDVGFFRSTLKETYVKIDGKEYGVSNDMATNISKGDKLKISGYLEQINKLEKVGSE